MFESIERIKKLSKEEFMALPGANEELYDNLHKAKSGTIYIEHADTGEKYYGHTNAFGEGLSVFLSNPNEWYRTSVIREINWKEEYFDTMNSRYYFKFIEDKYAEENN